MIDADASRVRSVALFRRASFPEMRRHIELRSHSGQVAGETKSMFKRLVALTFICWFAGVFGAAGVERGSAEDAQALVARAIDAYKAEGAAAFQRMTAPSTEFRNRDLYVFVIGPDHKTVAHGGDAKLVGMDVRQNIDPDGKAFGRAFVEEANEAGSWVEYKMLDPQSGAVLPKSSWIVRHDGYIFGAGIYKE